jgi:branched-chain amino acid transport system ATP-binding protein
MLMGEPGDAGATPRVQPTGGWLGGAARLPLAVLFGLALFESMDRATGQVLLPDIRDAFGLSNTGILAVTGVVAFVSLVLTVPIAVLADRTDRVRLMLVGATVFALFSIATSMVGLWVLPMSWVTFLVVRAGAGVGLATVLPTHNSLLADYYDVPYRPRVYAVHRAAEALGIFTGFIFAGLLGERFGWRAPYFVFALPCLAMVVVGMRLREPVRGHFERRAMGAEESVVELEEPPPSFEEAFAMVQRVKSLQRIYSAIPFFAVAFIGFGSLANLLYEQEFALDAARRGLYDAIAELGQLAGLVVSGIVGTRLVRRDPALVIRFVGVVAFVCSALAAGFALAPSVGVAVAVRVALAAALAAVLPSVFAALSLAIPARARSSGFSLAALYVIPGLLTLPFIGWVSDELGIRTGMLVMTPVFVIGGLIVSSAHRFLDDDVRNVWTATAARSELLLAHREGRITQLLVRGLDVHYGEVQVLFGIDLEVERGEIVALLGTNGAGKSTLLRAITGLNGASRGVVVLDGRDITHAPPHEVAELGVAMMPGGHGVFPSLTVAENLRVAGWMLGHDRRGRRSSRGTVGVESVLEVFPVLRERWEDPAANLSGGQQQMLALGMALLSEPELLCIDELSMGLAPLVVEQLLAVVRELAAAGTTVILVEQSVNLALRVAETAYFMEKGEIRFRGPTAELLERPDVLRSIFLQGARESLEERRTDPDRTPAPVVADHTATTLALEGLSVRFGGIRAVHDVHLEVASREIVGIIGPNGAGKTTLFDLISGYTRPERGRVVLEGTDVSRLPPHSRARLGLGRSFQDARLFPSLTVQECIAVALERTVEVRDPFNAALRLPVQQRSEWEVGERVDELVELMGLAPMRSMFVRELSTGSRRVVDLACILAHRPSVILLDEPSTGIAQREAEALAPLIRLVRDVTGASIVVIEHDMGMVAEVSDRVVALDGGSVIACGAPSEVLRDPAVVASYLGEVADEVAGSDLGGGRRW